MTGKVDKNGMTRGARHGFIVLFIILAVLSGAGIIVGARQVNTLNSQQADLRMALLAQCKFNKDLAGAPITVNPATRKASLLGVSIVVDARQAFRGLGCPGPLPPSAPSLVKWAKYYKLSYR